MKPDNIQVPDYDNPRIVDTPTSNAFEGSVSWAPTKSLWVITMSLIGVVGGYYSASIETLAVFLVTSGITLCFGHSLGMHRRFIHHSYECPRWLEYLFVYLGVLVGLAGPIGMMHTHDLRDWAQRQKRCHAYFGHKTSFLKDGFWQIHCDIKLQHPPEFQPDSHISNSRFYQFIEKTWMWQQLPLALCLFFLGGVSWVVWGVCLRVCVSITGHWLIGYFAHNKGHSEWHVKGAAVQGYNIKFCGLITMGECWHNNHHAFPGSALLGINANQTDPGWWMLLILKKLGLVWNIKTPEDLPNRSELHRI
ncbi:MAG: acyl-CoA desaturase [Oleispira sp.]|nr:acyl-CoA desaturase [Oleispira sp.]MBL4882690.1 acyl-CoA desaturase [Oleispira sp.]